MPSKDGKKQQQQNEYQTMPNDDLLFVIFLSPFEKKFTDLCDRTFAIDNKRKKTITNQHIKQKQKKNVNYLLKTVICNSKGQIDFRREIYE